VLRRVGLLAGLAAAVAAATVGCGGSDDDDAASQPDCRGDTPYATTIVQPSASARTFRLTKLADGPLYVTHIAAAPGDDSTLYLVVRRGAVYALDRRSNLVDERHPLLDIQDQVRTNGEEGLLSIAFHPGYARNRRFYVYFNDRKGDINVVEYRADGRRARPGSGRRIFFVDKTDDVDWHNGGQLQFGPDGLLYLATGDSAHTPAGRPPAPATDPKNQAQDPSLLFGKLVRLDVEQEKPRPELVAYGLRNPWRFSFDRETGDMYVADVGFHVWEEVDYVPKGQQRLLNFGWSVCEGHERFRELDAAAKKPARPRRLLGEGTLAPPIIAYRHTGGTAYCQGPSSITGGHVYRGKRIPALRGRYVFADYCSGELWSAAVDGPRVSGVRKELELEDAFFITFGEDADGELYLAGSLGTVYRLDPR
jgi:glucose/arabinose dehydrogenase